MGLLVALCASAAAGPTATLMGRITNSAGGAIPSTRVDAVNIETHTTLTAETNHEGLYYMPGISPGMYRIVVMKFGMKTIVKPSVELPAIRST